MADARLARLPDGEELGSLRVPGLGIDPHSDPSPIVVSCACVVGMEYRRWNSELMQLKAMS